jgi:opacity protein-like surface antigen
MVSQAAENQIEAEQYVGLGVSRFSINSEHPSIDDQSITGISLLFGFRYRNHVIELSMGGGSGIEAGPTSDIYYPADSADYSAITLSYQYQFRGLRLADNVFPYLGLGYNFNSINWENYVYDHSGDGYAIIGGLIITIEKLWAVNLSIRRYSFSGERFLFSSDDYPDYTTEVYELTANVVFHFNLTQ